MTDFVVNEWFWSDLQGENGAKHQAETFELMERLTRSEHRLIWVEKSPFDEKAWRLCNGRTARLGGFFVVAIRQDSRRCLILRPEDLKPLPEELKGPVKPDDEYLVQTCLAVPSAILVTTDEPLAVVVSEIGVVRKSREEFLKAV